MAAISGTSASRWGEGSLLLVGVVGSGSGLGRRYLLVLRTMISGTQTQTQNGREPNCLGYWRAVKNSVGGMNEDDGHAQLDSSSDVGVGAATGRTRERILELSPIHDHLHRRGREGGGGGEFRAHSTQPLGSLKWPTPILCTPRLPDPVLAVRRGTEVGRGGRRRGPVYPHPSTIVTRAFPAAMQDDAAAANRTAARDPSLSLGDWRVSEGSICYQSTGGARKKTGCRAERTRENSALTKKGRYRGIRMTATPLPSKDG